MTDEKTINFVLNDSNPPGKYPINQLMGLTLVGLEVTLAV
jgi:hypothetical protein